mmetsp:Transcript_9555/g.24966  ORF Transcript_9555/g.24966 Transcript_9555/m.24966 type:complete len:463 (-) Transcript_9555:74-1462(-)
MSLGIKRPRDVWAWNFDAEFDYFLAACRAGPAPVTLALDTEFPGFLFEDPVWAHRHARYENLRKNVGELQPIQVGIAAASADGALLGAWCFNLSFDLARSRYSQPSVEFLMAAGLDFPRLAAEGICASKLSHRLGLMPFFSKPRASWVTFSGLYDWAYFLKLLMGGPLPSNVHDFEYALELLCPLRSELRDWLPRGSLDRLLLEHQVPRHGTAHTAGSDALGTLELFLHILAIRYQSLPAPTRNAIASAQALTDDTTERRSAPRRRRPSKSTRVGTKLSTKQAKTTCADDCPCRSFGSRDAVVSSVRAATPDHFMCKTAGTRVRETEAHAQQSVEASGASHSEASKALEADVDEDAELLTQRRRALFGSEVPFLNRWRVQLWQRFLTLPALAVAVRPLRLYPPADSENDEMGDVVTAEFLLTALVAVARVLLCIPLLKACRGERFFSFAVPGFILCCSYLVF